eukprot:CAMPEP_0197862120 /NCGR_PEP_ID=MMETSP1438-20131217/38634_1 /TAXON_ID=1461541 /ORGANISM="Pterosperma sp., Strain CCMP1384" /LENGTH=593 /DNA_ID=CAMNT_0043479557 /DNA_START=697 /DNA_END=2478 /DNA_ORIENTATION=-
MMVAFLSEITENSKTSNTKVGLVTALQGATELVTAFPAGWAADRFSRSRIISLGGIILLVSIGATGYAVISSATDLGPESFYLLAMGLGFFGFAQGIINGPAQALLADSLTTGIRDVYYNWLFILYLLGSTVGPLLAVILFSIWQGYTSHNEHWPIPYLRTVILIGLGLEVPCALLMFLFRDDRSLGAASRAITEKRGGSERGSEDSERGSEPLLRGMPADVAAEVEEEIGKEDEVKTAEEIEEEREEAAIEAEWMREAGRMTGCGGWLNPSHVPYILFCSSLVISIASGMTIKFFPLFFKNDVRMSPAEVQTIYFIVPIVMAMCSDMGVKISKYVGRSQTSVLLRLIGLACFGGMVILYHLNVNRWLVVVLYVVRTAFMNSTYPIDEGILMDYVPKNQRARWKALESVASFGWCGSAMIGGVIADKKGYTFTFLVTITMQFTATMIFSLLTTVVSKTTVDDVRQRRKQTREQQKEKEGGVDGEGGGQDATCQDKEPDTVAVPVDIPFSDISIPIHIRSPTPSPRQSADRTGPVNIPVPAVSMPITINTPNRVAHTVGGPLGSAESPGSGVEGFRRRWTQSSSLRSVHPVGSF